MGEFDGNEFGGGTVTLHAYGPNADALFAIMGPTLRELPFRPAHAILLRTRGKPLRDPAPRGSLTNDLAGAESGSTGLCRAPISG